MNLFGAEGAEEELEFDDAGDRCGAAQRRWCGIVSCSSVCGVVQAVWCGVGGQVVVQCSLAEALGPSKGRKRRFLEPFGRRFFGQFYKPGGVS